MNRSEFGVILNSIVVPDGTAEDEINKRVFPISQASFDMMPSSLYRYRPDGDNQIDAFEKDVTYALTADMYNDPYDTLIKCDKDGIKAYLRQLLSVETLSQLRAFIQQGNDIPEEIKKGNPSAPWNKIKDKLLDVEDVHFWQANIDATLSQLSSQIDFYFPILAKTAKRFSAYACFSEVVDSILMWSHYASSHKGFVLEYDFKSTLENPIKNMLILPVIYSDERFDASAFMLWAFMTFWGSELKSPDVTAHMKVALHKSLDWEYEKEWRMIEGTPRNPFDKTPSAVVYKPKAVYYGCEMDLEKKQRLHEIASSKGIMEFEMYIDIYSSKYEMKYRPYVPVQYRVVNNSLPM